MLSLTGNLIRRHYYYSLNNNGVAYIKAKLGITEQKVQPRTHALRAEALEPDQEERPRGDRGDRGNRGERGERSGFRGRGNREGGFRRPREAGNANEGAAPQGEQAAAAEAM